MAQVRSLTSPDRILAPVKRLTWAEEEKNAATVNKREINFFIASIV